MAHFHKITNYSLQSTDNKATQKWRHTLISSVHKNTVYQRSKESDTKDLTVHKNIINGKADTDFLLLSGQI